MKEERNTSKISFINLEREKRRPLSIPKPPNVVSFWGILPVSILNRLEGSEYAQKRQKQFKKIRTIFERENEKPGPNVIFLKPPQDSA